MTTDQLHSCASAPEFSKLWNHRIPYNSHYSLDKELGHRKDLKELGEDRMFFLYIKIIDKNYMENEIVKTKTIIRMLVIPFKKANSYIRKKKYMKLK
jgi:hypothetical protein